MSLALSNADHSRYDAAMPKRKAKRPGEFTPKTMRTLRESLDLTQAAMAKRLNSTLRAYQSWEYGVNEIPGPVQLLLRLLSDQKI